jgi:alkylation response protein AidB-like acyl-CoA dehydrogenase
VDLELTEDQASVRQTFARFFEKESAIGRVRAAEDTGGFDPQLWASTVAAGLPMMGVAEEVGGGGGNLVDLALVAIEAGRRLAPVPLAEAMVAARVLAAAPAGAALLAKVGAGTMVPTVAIRPPVGDTARLVPGGAVADIVVALVDHDLVAVHGGMGPAPQNLAALPIADRRVTGERTVLFSGTQARAVHDSAVEDWKILTAATLVGIQAEAQRLGIEYIRGRRVFGTQLAWFQAVQHRFADVATIGKGAELLALEAAWSRAAEPHRTAALAEMALLFCADAAFHTCRESLQFHGGYGYTLEYDIQLYFRRAKALALAAGPSRHRYQTLATALFGTGREEERADG